MRNYVNSDTDTLFALLGEHFFFHHRRLVTVTDIDNQAYCERCKDLCTKLDAAIKALPDHA